MATCAEKHLAAIALGSNLGDREANLRAAIDALSRREGVKIRAVSSLHETSAVVLEGDEPQPAYLNAAALLETALSARELLEGLLEIERRLGRRRKKGKRWRSRTLDLDLLLYDDVILDEPGLTIPHPAMHRRAFVLDPLSEIAADMIHPVLERSVSALRDALSREAST